MDECRRIGEEDLGHAAWRSADALVTAGERRRALRREIRNDDAHTDEARRSPDRECDCSDEPLSATNRVPDPQTPDGCADLFLGRRARTPNTANGTSRPLSRNQIAKNRWIAKLTARMLTGVNALNCVGEYSRYATANTTANPCGCTSFARASRRAARRSQRRRPAPRAESTGSTMPTTTGRAREERIEMGAEARNLGASRIAHPEDVTVRGGPHDLYDVAQIEARLEVQEIAGRRRTDEHACIDRAESVHEQASAGLGACSTIRAQPWSRSTSSSSVRARTPSGDRWCRPRS